MSHRSMLERTAAVLQLASLPVLGLLASTALAAADAGAPATNPERTDRADEPPRSVGPSWDRDDAMPAHASAIASYVMNAKLDADTHRITGRSTITWTNSSRVEVRELWFHLYLNAFRNDRTLFLRSPFGAGRSGDKAREYGWIEVESLECTAIGAGNLWSAAAKHSPDDPDDRTDIRVPLPTTVPPGESLRLELKWKAQLPGIVERTGHSRGFHLVAQWFPKLARLEPDGTWAHFAFHPQSEFYADYGSYDVTLDVPDSMVVGATGERRESRSAGGRKTVRYVQDDVHDFAWTAWDGFTERSWVIDGVDVRLLAPPGHERNVAATERALRFALPHFSKHYGRYPYRTLTVVHPPAHARNAGGMEYPTLITTGGPWWIGPVARAVESVTVHELGHQWFYGLVASNESAWPFLDEGLNSYAEQVAMEERWGRGSLVDWPHLSLSTSALQRVAAARRGRDDVVAKPAAAFASFDDLGALVYARTATALATVGRVWGEERLLTALGRYARRYRYAHPGPRHLLRVVREVMGDAPADVLQRALFERGWVDYHVSEPATSEVAEPAGVFGDGEQREERSAAESASGRWTGRARVYRRGTLELPVDIELLAADGTRTRQRWDGRGAWTTVSYSGTSPLVAVHVDPDRRVLLDDDLLNNAASRDPGGMPRITERAAYWLELAATWVGP